MPRGERALSTAFAVDVPADLPAANGLLILLVLSSSCDRNVTKDVKMSSFDVSQLWRP